MSENRAKRVKHGGRKKGVKNKGTSASAKKAAEIAASGLTPLEYMLERMRDETIDHAVRLDASKAAAPYVHPKLANIEHSGPDGGAITVIVKQFGD